jgi:hypothetical protein
MLWESGGRTVDKPKRNLRVVLATCVLAASMPLVGVLSTPASAAWIWVEGEKSTKSTMNRHPWYAQVKRDQLSGGDFASNFNKDKPGEAEYAFDAPAAGGYEFWVRANPVGTRLSYRLNGGQWTQIDLQRSPVGSTNIAADGKPDIRFIAWVKVGQVPLKAGSNAIAFRMDSENSNHGSLDCFVFSSEPFRPMGIYRPDQMAEQAAKIAGENKGWFAFDPKADPYDAAAALDLRWMNEKQAGDGGFIAAKDGEFVHSRTGQPVRFWAVNGPPGSAKDRATLAHTARMLAKHGVNLVRVHGGYFDETGAVKMEAVKHTIEIVEEMKAEGIYTHLSIYFPLWLAPKPGTPWLQGYDGKQKPFAALYFNKDFQRVYREWWKALLTTPSEKTGKRLVDEPAVAGAEIINEDSFFFWTFATKNVPEPQLAIIEAMFGDWLKKKYGSIDGAIAKWNGVKTPRDAPAEGRMGFRTLWDMFNQKTQRDKDATAFLLEVQQGFYQDTYKYLRGLGFKGLITASNWATASPQVFGPIEKLSYTVGDFLDRHGYFGCNEKGEFAGWSVRDGYTYADRSALKFEPETPGKPRQFVHPVMDIHYNGKPSMISETTFCRPNRYRSEAPLFYAAYGALQHSDAIVNFALDSSTWTVKPGFFMQPWTLMSPSMMGQFPAAALIFRQRLVAPGDTLVDLSLKVQDLLDLKGTPLPQDAAFDELRLKDVPQGTEIGPGNVIDPLVHFAGRTSVTFSAEGGPPRLKDLKPFIDRAGQTVTSTTGELRLDYGKGVLTINAPAAQGVSGALGDAGTVNLKDMTISSDMPLGHIVAVSMDGKPLASSQKILLQVMSEEKNGDFQTEPAGGQLLRIKSIGHDPWMVRELKGTVRFKRPDAARLKVTALDPNGYRAKEVGAAAEIRLESATLYYLIAP